VLHLGIHQEDEHAGSESKRRVNLEHEAKASLDDAHASSSHVVANCRGSICKLSVILILWCKVLVHLKLATSRDHVNRKEKNKMDQRREMEMNWEWLHPRNRSALG
jgi:hypothetical protein